jgi:cytochrome oxidase assembly protein ShyY1
VWVTPKAQELASKVCLGIGVVVAVIGMTALFGFWQVDVDKAKKREIEMYEQRSKDGSIYADEHKLSQPIRKSGSGSK